VGTFLLLWLVLAGCAAPGRDQRNRIDQDQDGRLISRALQEADSGGSTFSMSERIVLSGGDIPGGQQARVNGSATGSLLEGRVHMDYSFARTKSSVNFEVIVADGGFFIRPVRTATWAVTPEPAVTELYPAVRLPLIRESVLLARSVGGASIQTSNPASCASSRSFRPRTSSSNSTRCRSPAPTKQPS